MGLKQVFEEMTPDDGQKKKMLGAVLAQANEDERRTTHIIKPALAFLGLALAATGIFAAYNAVKRSEADFKGDDAADSGYTAETEASETQAEDFSASEDKKKLCELYELIFDREEFFDEENGIFDTEKYEENAEAFYALQQKVAADCDEMGLLPKLIVPIEDYTLGDGYVKNPGGAVHFGLDFTAEAGAEIYAAAKGTVIDAYDRENASGYGYYVEIDHGNGVTTMYSQCSALLAERGQTVEQGELIALVGDTGYSEAPQLHFEMRIDGVPCDPEPFLDLEVG